jgi:hypothetical protein
MQALPKGPYSGIIDKDIEPSELQHSPTHRLLSMGLICDRSGNRESLALLLHDIIHYSVQFPLPSSRNHDRCPFPRKDFRDRLTDTRVASCNDSDLPLQPIHRA